MNAAGATRAGRRFAEQQMIDSCVITRAVRSELLNESTGKYDSTPTVIYSGVCRYVKANLTPLIEDVQAQRLTVGSDVLHIPVDAAGSADVLPDDVADITIAALDSRGVTARVQARADATFAVARRLPIEVIL